MSKVFTAEARPGKAAAGQGEPAGSAARPCRVFACGGPRSDRSALGRRLADALGPERIIVTDHDERGIEGALDADCALLFAVGNDGLTREARQLCCALSVLRIPAVILAIGYGDDAEDCQAEFEDTAGEFAALAKALGLGPEACIPVTAAGAETGWYAGPALQAAVQTLPALNGRSAMPFRMIVEEAETRGGEIHCRGRILAGTAAACDEIAVYPEGTALAVLRAEAGSWAAPGAAASVVLAGAASPAPGDILAAREPAPSVADQVAAQLIWLADEPMLPGRVYALHSGLREATATISALKHRLNAETLEHQAAKTLGASQIGLCNLSISRPLVFDAGGATRELGQFRLVDRETGVAVGVGTIAFGLHRATNLKWQALDIDKRARAAVKGQRPCVLWFTGLSGAGKSSVANILEKRLHAAGRHTYLLDGDNVRHGLNRDLGFTDADRVENMRRVAETAKLLVDAGLIVMVSFISPFRMERLMARELFEDGEFIEIYVDAPLDVCEARDPKGLYKKARDGLVKNFTGIDSAYEPPEGAEIHLHADESPAEALAGDVVAELERRGLI